MKQMIAILLLLCFMFICGCSAKRDKIPDASEEEIAQMRSEYQYVDTGFVSASLQNIPDGQWAKQFDALLVAEIVGEFSDSQITAYPGTADDPGPQTTITTYYLPIKITEVLGTKDGYKVDVEEAYLSFSGAVFSPNGSFDIGRKLVVFVADYGEHKGVKEFNASTYTTFYLTNSGNILSITDESTVDAYSGRAMDSFKNDMEIIAKKSGW